MSSEHTNVLSTSEADQCPSEKVEPVVDQDQYLSREEVAAAGDWTTDGLRVLAVDDSVVCLKVLVGLLHQCKYNVTETTNPVEALQILRTRKQDFDLVITDLRMLEMDGLVLLQKISLEMDLPVVTDDNQENIMKAIRCGARDYIIKPPRMAQIKNVWQHVVRKHLFGLSSCKKDVNNNTSNVTIEEEETKSPPPVEESKRKLSEIEGDSYGEKRKADEEAPSAWNSGTGSSGASNKKRRVNWTVDLHNKFIDAIEEIGPNAVPMEILKVMNVPWLTRANVASHLQKFKNALRDQAQSASHARNGYSNNMNSAAGQNGYQSGLNSTNAAYSMGMMTQAVSTNPYFSQRLYCQQYNLNSRIIPLGTNKHILNHNQHYNLPMIPSAYPAPTMLNNAPLPPRSVLYSHPPVPRFNGLRFSNLDDNMTNPYSLSQPFPALPAAPALFPAPAAYTSALVGNMPAATSSVVNADSKHINMLPNGQNDLGLAPKTENMYAQLDWTAASDFQDTLMSNSDTRTCNFDVDPFKTTPMETWSGNNNLLANTAHTTPFQTSNLSNYNSNNTNAEELPVDASFQPINTNLSDEDDNDELNSMVNSFNFEGPPSL